MPSPIVADKQREEKEEVDDCDNNVTVWRTCNDGEEVVRFCNIGQGGMPYKIGVEGVLTKTHEKGGGGRGGYSWSRVSCKLINELSYSQASYDSAFTQFIW